MTYQQEKEQFLKERLSELRLAKKERDKLRYTFQQLNEMYDLQRLQVEIVDILKMIQTETITWLEYPVFIQDRIKHPYERKVYYFYREQPKEVQRLYMVLPNTDLDKREFVVAYSEIDALQRVGAFLEMTLEEMKDYDYQAIEVPRITTDGFEVKVEETNELPSCTYVDQEKTIRKLRKEVVR